MSEGSKVYPRRYGEGLFSAISAGFFLILAGSLYMTTPSIFEKILAFFRDFDIVRVTNMSILLPAPAFPANHLIIYSTITQFSFVWSIFQIVILALRFVAHSPPVKKGETVSNLVFWSGTIYLIPKFLNDTTTITTWFVFWSAIIMLIGASLIIRAIILAVRI